MALTTLFILVVERYEQGGDESSSDEVDGVNVFKKLEAQIG